VTVCRVLRVIRLEINCVKYLCLDILLKIYLHFYFCKKNLRSDCSFDRERFRIRAKIGIWDFDTVNDLNRVLERSETLVKDFNWDLPVTVVIIYSLADFTRFCGLCLLSWEVSRGREPVSRLRLFLSTSRHFDSFTVAMFDHKLSSWLSVTLSSPVWNQRTKTRSKIPYFFNCYSPIRQHRPVMNKNT